MKLNNDAMRDLLVVMQDQPRDIDVNKVVFDERLKGYNKNELGYAIEKMIESYLLNGKTTITKTGKTITIESITVKGHQYLRDIESE
jgi:Hypothetical protein (DUF2513)